MNALSELIPHLMNLLRVHSPEHYEGFMVAPFGVVPNYVMDEGESSPWWDSVDARCVAQDLVDILDDSAPEGMYFGMHPESEEFDFWPLADD